MTTLNPPALPTFDDARAAWGSCCAPGGDACSPAQRLPWFRLILGLFVAGQTMLLGLAINLTPPESTAARLVLQGGMLLAVLIVAALLGTPLVRDAARALRRGRVTMEMLFALSLAGALAYSCVSMARGEGAVYFEVVAVVLIVYSVGRAVSVISRGRALASVAELTAPLALAQRVGENGRVESVPVGAVRAGDRVRVDAGRAAPVDGVICLGRAFVRDASFTGEWSPRVLGVGDRLDSGAVPLDGAVDIEATAPGVDRRIDRLVRAIEEARARPSSLQRRADRFVARFLPLVLLAATAAFIGWTFARGVDAGLTTAMAVLLIACPCAAGLATPLVLWTAIAKLAQRGLMLRGGDGLERLAAIDSAIFDKTGTLGHPELTLDALTLHGPASRHAATVAMIAAVERCSAHPVATALRGVDTTHGGAGVRVDVKSVTVLPGEGVEAEVVLFPSPPGGGWPVLRPGEGAASVAAGIDGSEAKHPLPNPPPEGEGAGYTLRLVRGHCNTPDTRVIEAFVDGQLAATATLGERLRDAAAEAVEGLRALGVAVRVMTGDSVAGAASVTALAAVDAQLTPDDKRRMVAALRETSPEFARPLFVGDGLNDAAAMGEAHVSVALSDGAAVTVEAADATLHGGDLRRVPEAVTLARRAVALVDSHLRWAVAYNVVGIVVASAGLLHPIFAALLMAGSSVLVSARSLRLTRSLGAPASEPRMYMRGSELAPPPRSLAAQEHAPATLRSFGLLHVAGLVGQALILAMVMGLDTYATALLVAAAACVTGWLLLVWRRLPAWADMTFAMVTLGGLGMNLGWWADLGFTAAPSGAGCCAAALSESPLHLLSWMNGGMLLLGVPAMFLVRRRPEPFDLRRWCCTGMLVLGVPGMVVGMVAGSVLAGSVTAGWPTEAAVMLDYAAMMLGMCAGMLVPHALHGTE